MLTPQEERRHLHEGPRPGERPPGVGTITFTATCAGNADEVLGRLRAVMAEVLARQDRQWPSTDQWLEVLPSWFVDQFASESELDAFAARWDSMAVEEREAIGDIPWALSAWLAWVSPGGRYWHWWDASAPNSSTVLIEVQIDGLPAPTEALDHLVRAAGAVEIGDAR